MESQSVLATLLERSLIRVAGRSSTVGRPLLYETTGEFLRYFGLRDLSDLPEIDEFERALGFHQDDDRGSAGVSDDESGRSGVEAGIANDETE